MPAGFRPLVADNASTDGSARVAADHGARVVAAPDRGFGAACHAGLLAAGTEVVCVMDADASLDPAELPRLAAALAALEVAAGPGWCWAAAPGGRGAWPPHARLGNAVLARSLNRPAAPACTTSARCAPPAAPTCSPSACATAGSATPGDGAARRPRRLGGRRDRRRLPAPHRRVEGHRDPRRDGPRVRDMRRVLAEVAP